jgi:hypothetical protein
MDILLFSHDAAYAGAAVASGATGVVVDWEWRGKADRQQGQGTEINHGGVVELQAIRTACGDRVVCRINNDPLRLALECELAIEHGAVELWLPMVRGVAEVETCLRRIDGRARLGLMAETREALRLGREFAGLPLSRIYVGLHDYRIDCGGHGLFDPIVDGTLDRFREDYPGPLAVAGVTCPDGGSPVPQHLLLAAMARLHCAFGIARRGFRADVPQGRIAWALEEIRGYLQQLHGRNPIQVDAAHRALAELLGRLPTITPPPVVELACAH